MTILEEITGFKKIEIREQKSRVPYKKLEQSNFFMRNTLKLTEYLADPLKTAVITEFKRKSPSKGMINEKAGVVTVTKGYAGSGASGLSVLTDSKYFGGSAEDLVKAREANEIPILRKDFTIDEYQVIEAKAIGADAILLIAACLDKKEIGHLAKMASSLNLQVILEVHELTELNMINDYITIMGVNNRNLKTFEVDIHTSAELARYIPSEFVKISESGISTPGHIKMLKDLGFNGFLIGEKFMKEEDPVEAFRSFLMKIK